METADDRRTFAQILQLAMWIRTISFVVGAHRPTFPFIHAIQERIPFKVKKLIESCCIIFQLKAFQMKEVWAGEVSASRVPVYGSWLRFKNTCKQFKFALNQILPTLFRLRDDESRSLL